jgi:aspartate aminotransferase-like enzyme
MHHRDPEFIKLARECLQNAKKIFQTRNDVLILPSTGTYAMEMCAASIIEKGSKVITVNTGLFGRRFKEMIEIYGGKVIEVTADAGKGVGSDEISKVLQSEKDVKAIAMVHCETSTGAVNLIKDIGEEAKKHDVILMVDAVSSLGGMDIRPDDWGIDLLFTASQKCLGCPPGLSLLSVSDRAYEYVKKRREPIKSWSLNLVEWKDHLDREFPFRITPPVTLFYALHESFKLLLEEGLSNVFKRHEKVAQFLREGFKDLGLELFVDEKYLSNTVTCLKVPKDLTADLITRELLHRWGIMVAGGLQELKGKIIRIAHMGNTSTMFHARVVLAAFRDILATRVKNI